MPRDSERITRDFYLHGETDHAYWLSPDGYDRHSIPKSLAKPTGALRIVKVDRQRLEHGEFEIEKWKAEECGFIFDEVKTYGQGELKF